jgi:hypothetical protein
MLVCLRCRFFSKTQPSNSDGELSIKANLGVLKRFCSKYGSLSGGDCPLELDFCAKPLEIPVNHRDRQRPAAVLIRDRAVSRVKLPIDFGFIPLFGVTDISETEIVLLGPKERDGVEAFPSTQDVARGGLPLAFPQQPSVRHEFARR